MLLFPSTAELVSALDNVKRQVELDQQAKADSLPSAEPVEKLNDNL
jgi:hypothetical protein